MKFTLKSFEFGEDAVDELVQFRVDVLLVDG